MNTLQSESINASKTVWLLGWGLGLLFILKSLDFFLSINLNTESELSLVILESILLSVSGVAMLLLALGTIRIARWVRIPLYVVFVSNGFFIVYSTVLVPNWMDASFSLIGAVVLFFYLTRSKVVSTGRRLLGLQILTILTLLPGTIFIALSVVFPDQALQDDSSLRLDMTETISDRDNLYVTLTNLGDQLPTAAEAADEMVSEYPAGWIQTEATQLVQQLQPNINVYMIGTNQAYQCPKSVNNFSMDAELCKLNLMRDYAEIMQFAALYEAERGNSILAQAYATAPIKVGLTMLQSDNVTLIEYLVGLASLNIGLDTLEKLEQENMISRFEIEEFLSKVSVTPESLRMPLQREYTGLRNQFDGHLNPPQTYVYHPNRTRNELYNFMNSLIEYSTASCSIDDTVQSDTVEFLDYVEDRRERAQNFARPNSVGNILVSTTIASLTRVRDRVCEVNAKISSYAE